MPRPILVIEQTALDPPGHVGTWLREAGHELDVVRPYAGDRLPADLADHAGLLVLGGDVGAYDDEVAPWLPTTRALLADAVSEQVPTLAICLGHQLLAVATGGRVSLSPTGQQGGTLSVGLRPAAASDPLLGPVSPNAVAAHWNNDIVVDLPPGAVELARTPSGVQAMRVGERAWGLQFHPEVDAEIVRPWAAADVDSGNLAAERAAAWLAEMEANDAIMQRTWRPVIHRFATLLE